jgi:hypothetical protein
VNGEQSVVIVNGNEDFARKLLQFLAKLGYRVAENYDAKDTKIVVFTK